MTTKIKKSAFALRYISREYTHPKTSKKVPRYSSEIAAYMEQFDTEFYCNSEKHDALCRDLSNVANARVNLIDSDEMESTSSSLGSNAVTALWTRTELLRNGTRKPNNSAYTPDDYRPCPAVFRGSLEHSVISHLDRERGATHTPTSEMPGVTLTPQGWRAVRFCDGKFVFKKFFPTQLEAENALSAFNSSFIYSGTTKEEL